MKVLMIDSAHPNLQSGLEDLGYQVDCDFESSKEEISSKLANYAGLIVRSRFPIDRDFIEAGSLRFIGRVGAGLENIDLEAAGEHGIEVFNAPEGNRDAVGEQAIGMLLMLFNNLSRADAEVRQGVWRREENRGYEIQGKTIGIIGYGNMGSALARKLKGFEAEVIAYDKYLSGFGNELVKEVSLEELQARADVISLHIPQTPETLHMIDEGFIAACTKDFYLINTARGKSVKTTALVEALKSGKIKGACLDVLEYEKTSFEKLFTHELPADFQYLTRSDRVVLSPHIAGWTHESNRKLAEVLVAKVAGLNLLKNGKS